MRSSPDGDAVGYGDIPLLALRIDVLPSDTARKALDMAIEIEKFFSEAHRTYDQVLEERSPGPCPTLGVDTAPVAFAIVPSFPGLAMFVDHPVERCH